MGGAGVNPSGGAPVVSSGPGVTSPQTSALPQPGQVQGSFESIYSGQPRKQLLEMNAMGQEVKPSLEHPASLSSINGNRIEVQTGGWDALRVSKDKLEEVWRGEESSKCASGDGVKPPADIRKMDKARSCC
ncbi:hypothetical protein F5141DRAFT_1068077 [Pisolithus sp. B1]|nr:hypothetical protein F5141DRAFT_1068077 [Pisolithus sp. B1]